MPRLSPSSQCGLGAKSKAGCWPQRITSTLSASLLPGGTLSWVRLGMACQKRSHRLFRLGCAALQLFRLLLDLARLIHHVAIDEEGRQHFQITMLPGVHIQHEAGQGSFQPGALAPVDSKTGPRNLRRPLEVKNTQALAQLPMWLGREIESRRLSPPHYFYVLRFALSWGDAVLGQVRDSH